MSDQDWSSAREADRAGAGLRRHLGPRPPGDDRLLDLASEDYLGLARDPRVIESAAEAARAWGGGVFRSPLVAGSAWVHEALRRALADHVGTPAALLFASGHLANVGAVAALSGPEVLAVSGAGHSWFVDACRLSGARAVVTAHRDVEAVRRALRDRVERHALVVTDAVSSVDGQAAPVTALHEVAREHGAALVVDESRTIGVVGERGAGACSEAGLAAEPDVVITVTLSNALGAQGGAVLAASAVVEHLVAAARPFVLDTGLAPAAAGAAVTALDILSREPWLARASRERARDLARIAATAGLRRSEPDAALVGIRMGTEEVALEAAAQCVAHGLRVTCLRPPAVPDGVSRLRLTGRADLNDDDLDRVSSALSAVGRLLAER